MHDKKVLQVTALKVGLKYSKTLLPIVKGVSLDIERGRTLGLIGESGCGKTVTCMALLGLLEGKKWSVDGSVKLQGRELQTLSARKMGKLRGSEIATIMQNPMNAFNPLQKIGTHFVETIRAHKDASKSQALQEACNILHQVGFDNPSLVLNKYPFQCSGGMLQRIMIAIALTMHPALLVADEPTTALDVTIQYQIIRQLAELKSSQAASILLVTHDLGVAAALADDIAVMYNGYVVEHGPARELLNNPRHPYTQGLMSAKPGFHKQRLAVIQGTPPKMTDAIEGCPFAPRCGEKKKECREFNMSANLTGDGYMARCAYC